MTDKMARSEHMGLVKHIHSIQGKIFIGFFES